VVGQSLADAVEELTNAGLDAQVVDVDSDREPGTVTGQAPSPGTVVVEGTQVRINVSRGPKPVTVPNVIGFPYAQAAIELQRAEFGVARVDVDSDLAKGIVVEQDPDGGSSSSKGSTVTLSVSRGPVTTAVPDVTNMDVAIARATLQDAGFRTREVLEDTDDPTLDGVVLSQDPIGGTQEEQNSLVTLFVGRFTGIETEPTDTTTTP
jgi:serine/threonine-protein kinase